MISFGNTLKDTLRNNALLSSPTQVDTWNEPSLGQCLYLSCLSFLSFNKLVDVFHQFLKALNCYVFISSAPFSLSFLNSGIPVMHKLQCSIMSHSSLNVLVLPSPYSPLFLSICISVWEIPSNLSSCALFISSVRLSLLTNHYHWFLLLLFLSSISIWFFFIGYYSFYLCWNYSVKLACSQLFPLIIY